MTTFENLCLSNVLQSQWSIFVDSISPLLEVSFKTKETLKMSKN